MVSELVLLGVREADSEQRCVQRRIIEPDRPRISFPPAYFFGNCLFCRRYYVLLEIRRAFTGHSPCKVLHFVHRVFLNSRPNIVCVDSVIEYPRKLPMY